MPTGDSLDWLTTQNGLGIRIDRLVTVIGGLLSATYFDGIARVIGTVIDAFIIAPLEGLAAFVETAVGLLFGTPVAAIEASYPPLVAFVSRFGAFSFPIALAAVVLLAYLVVKGSELRG